VKKPYVTITDIAARAGVTAATVSLCLTNNPRISHATRERVLHLARELGYRPNPYISALMRSRRKRAQLPSHQPIVALVGAFDTPDGWRTTDAATIRQMREGAMERAAELGFKTQDFWLYQDDMTPERFSEVIYARSIDGVLLGPAPDESEPPRLTWEHFATVSLSTPFPDLAVPTVCNDHHLSSFQAVEQVHRLGYRRPGFVITKRQHQRLLGRWTSGFMMAQQMLPDIEPTPPLLVDNWSDASVLQDWVAREKPDVIITSTGGQVHEALTGAGWKIPQDIGLAVLSCWEVGHRFSGVYQNGQLIGATAMDVLIKMIERNERGLPDQATVVMVEGKWNPGKTLRSLRH
jgi:LacI family transcriptional regulator